ncbi:MAG: substrate-binding domain-containing protein [Acidimicrobiia bacterium]|nr:substrate-binding domain-containing protein [Acidimicrobiia bacterium]
MYAASSLADIMELVEEGYERDNPEVDLRMNLAGTNALVRQVNSGADAAILVAADASFLDDLLDPPAAPPVPLATNELTLAVPVDNPAGIDGPEDLSTEGVLTARCATGVPCGDATDAYLATNGFAISRFTEEANVRSVLAKVSTGEVDAGFVYRTDTEATDAVVEIPLSDAPRVTVTMARLDDGESTTDLARYLRSDEVADLFARLGFGPVDGLAAGGGG